MRIIIAFLVMLCGTVAADNHGTSQKFVFEWIVKPHFTDKSFFKSSHYHGTLVAQCNISAFGGGGLANLHKEFKKWVEERSEKHQWIKVANFFQVDKDQKIDAMKRPLVTTRTNQNGEVKLSMTGYLAYVPDERLVFYTESEKLLDIKGDENKRLKKVWNYYHFTKTQTPGVYNVLIRRFYKIEGYWYEPTDLFVQGVQGGTLKTFYEELLDHALPRWMNSL